jgi:hypothetical protein
LEGGREDLGDILFGCARKIECEKLGPCEDDVFDPSGHEEKKRGREGKQEQGCWLYEAREA